MLHITIGESEERVLRESNQFPQDDFMSFCLILSYGNIKNIEKEEYKELPSNNESWKVNIKGKLEELDEKIKKNKDIRIWYSRLDNEDICNMCFLVYYLSKYSDVNIYLSEVRRGWGGLGAYSSDEIINLIDRKELLKEKDKYKNLWIKLEHENSDIRIFENNEIVSHDFNYLDEQILNILTEYGEVKYWKLVADCMGKSICNFCQDIIFVARIDEMIKKNIIKITKITQEKNYNGELKTVKYVSIN